MFNEVVVVSVSAFQKAGQEADKNGAQNVWLTPVAGQIPNRALVVAGTVAEKAGLDIGKTLLVMVNEGAEDPTYGRQFNHTVLGEVKPMEIIGLRKDLGKASVLDVNPVANAQGPNAPAANTTPSMNTSSLGGNTGSTTTPPEAGKPAAGAKVGS